MQPLTRRAAHFVRIAPPSPTRGEGKVGERGDDKIETRLRASIHHDLHEIAHLDLGVGVQPVEHAKTLGGAVDAGHAVRQRFDGIAGLHGDDLDAQRPRGLDFLNLFILLMQLTGDRRS